MEIPIVIQNIAARPENYFGDHYYDCFVAFVEGFDAASSNRLIGGFREWLLTQTTDAEGSGMAWHRLILRLDYPEISENPLAWPSTHDEHVKAIHKAVDRLVDFHSLPTFCDGSNREAIKITPAG